MGLLGLEDLVVQNEDHNWHCGDWHQQFQRQYGDPHLNSFDQLEHLVQMEQL
jgi:hypothetical protein